jgi:hypothetical protein
MELAVNQLDLQTDGKGGRVCRGGNRSLPLATTLERVKHTTTTPPRSPLQRSFPLQRFTHATKADGIQPSAVGSYHADVWVWCRLSVGSFDRPCAYRTTERLRAELWADHHVEQATGVPDSSSSWISAGHHLDVPVWKSGGLACHQVCLPASHNALALQQQLHHLGVPISASSEERGAIIICRCLVPSTAAQPRIIIVER